MLTDGIQLISTTSDIGNLNIENGSSFPIADLTEGRAFYLDVDIQDHTHGLYIYHNSAWEPAVSTITLPATLEYTTNKNTANGYAGLDANAKVDSANLPTTLELLANKNTANGYAGLDANAKIAITQLPSIAITDTFTVADQTAMLALTAQTGDVAIRTDLSKSFILSADPASTLANWKELLTPTDTVTSVNGMTGAVTVASTPDFGTSFPGSPADKTLFYLTQASGNYKVGLYYYTASNTTWNQVYSDKNAYFDLSGYVPGLPQGGASLMLFTSARAFQIPANFSGSIAKSGVATTNNTIYSVKKNGVEVATLTFAAGSTAGVFSNQAAINFAIGDILGITAPTPIDSTHQEIMWTIVATLT